MTAEVVVFAEVLAALAIVCLVVVVVIQDRSIAKLREALDVTTRAVGREHAAGEILKSELAYLSASAQIRNVWVAGHAEMEAWLS